MAELASRPASRRRERIGRAATLLPFVLCLAAGSAAALGPEVKEARLANGAKVVFSEQRNLPMVLVKVLVDGGYRWDPPGREGTANLVAELLTEGTTTRSAAEISAAIDFVGGALAADADTDYADLNLRVLAKDLDLGLELLADVLVNPVFASAELQRRCEAALAALRAARDNPTEVALREFRRRLFPDEPYGHPAIGEEDAVARITREDVRSFYRRHYRPSAAYVIVVGDLGFDETRQRLDRAFAAWKGEAGEPFVYPAPRPPAPESHRIAMQVSQASIVLGHRGIARGNPDYETVAVMNYILGSGGFSSRLMENIRTQGGLAYSIGSTFVTNRFPGPFQIVMQTKNESAAEAIARVRAEVERIAREPVDAAELEDAKRYLTGSFPLRLDSNTKILEFLAQVSFYDLGYDYADRYIEKVNAVTIADVQRVARAYLHPDQMIEVVVADLSRAGLPEER
jgi:zinc protease